MKDIPGDAILFDMYYMAKDPVPQAGEKRDLPKVEFKPVDESTPVFRNFNISNVYCNGAERAIYLRGLPEMHLQNIVLQNMVFQTKIGIEVEESTGIQFKNIKLITAKTNPVVNIVHSDKLVFDNISYSTGAAAIFKVSGDRASNIILKNIDASKAKMNAIFESGASEKSIIFE
jgi:hypothetical protein